MIDKATARKTALLIRRKLGDYKTISMQVVDEIIKQHLLDNYTIIGIYYPLEQEINLLPLIYYYPDKTFCIPKTKDEISFHKIESINAVVKGKFKVYEPVNDNQMVPQIILVPCVSINKRGFRLGYGKGYYDRYFSKHSIRCIGVCYQDCLLDFEEESFDVKLDFIVAR